jgi:hypothetical protein
MLDLAISNYWLKSNIIPQLRQIMTPKRSIDWPILFEVPNGKLVGVYQVCALPAVVMVYDHFSSSAVFVKGVKLGEKLLYMYVVGVFLLFTDGHIKDLLF